MFLQYVLPYLGSHAVLDLSHWIDATLDLLELFVLFMHYQVMKSTLKQ